MKTRLLILLSFLSFIFPFIFKLLLLLLRPTEPSFSCKTRQWNFADWRIQHPHVTGCLLVFVLEVKTFFLSSKAFPILQPHISFGFLCNLLLFKLQRVITSVILGASSEGIVIVLMIELSHLFFPLLWVRSGQLHLAMSKTLPIRIYHGSKFACKSYFNLSWTRRVKHGA